LADIAWKAARVAAFFVAVKGAFKKQQVVMAITALHLGWT
jgi:hypothetical protein